RIPRRRGAWIGAHRWIVLGGPPSTGDVNRCNDSFLMDYACRPAGIVAARLPPPREDVTMRRDNTVRAVLGAALGLLTIMGTTASASDPPPRPLASTMDELVVACSASHKCPSGQVCRTQVGKTSGACAPVATLPPTLPPLTALPKAAVSQASGGSTGPGSASN